MNRLRNGFLAHDKISFTRTGPLVIVWLQLTTPIDTSSAARTRKILSAIWNAILWSVETYLTQLIITAWWCHQMETFSVLLAICAGNSPVPGEFPTQRPVTRSFDVFFYLRPINGWVDNRKAGDLRWPSSPLWRHRNGKYRKCINFVVNVLQVLRHLQAGWWPTRLETLPYTFMCKFGI